MKGIEFGISQIMTAGISFQGGMVRNNFGVLIEPNVTRTVNVTYDPSQQSLNVQRVVSNSDLLNDVAIACQLNLITSPHVCKYLKEKAKTIQDALNDNHKDKAKFFILSFLHNLGELRGDHCDDEDDRGSISKNALTSLIEDTEALLAQLGENVYRH